jgi:hypothetical protein
MMTFTLSVSATLRHADEPAQWNVIQKFIPFVVLYTRQIAVTIWISTFPIAQAALYPVCLAARLEDARG